MSREIVLQQVAGPPAYSFAEKMEMAKMVAASGLFPGVTSPQSAMTLMMLCEADGLHPVEAMRRYHILHGRPTMRADAMQAEFQSKGGRVEWVESSEDACEAVFRHATHAPKGFTVRVTMAEAKERGLYSSNPNYKKHPRAMLRARVISEGVRAVLPGIVVGVYTPEEVEGFDRPAKAIDVTPRRQAEADAIGAELVDQIAAPAKAVEPKRSNPKERHQAPAEVVAEVQEHEDSRPHRNCITNLVDSLHRDWKVWCDTSGIEYEPLLNIHQVENHLVTASLSKGLDPARVETDGKRDGAKCRNVLAKAFRHDPEKFAQAVDNYCDEKIAEKKREITAALDGPAVEDESQEVTEETFGDGDDQVTIERPKEAAVG